MQTLLDHVHWIEHFRRNQVKRDEPDWNAGIVLPDDTIRKLVKSLEQFELGDGGGPGYLIAWDREKFLQAPENRELVDLWFQEEHEHSRLLGKLVQRFHGRSIQSHWSFAVFCAVRKWLGIRFELRTLLLTEIVSNVYYRLLLRYGNDPALQQVCRLIIRDETGHIAFHRDRLARRGRQHRRIYGYAWQMLFNLMGLAAGTMLWVNHGPALCQLGATTEEFYREILKDMSQFIITLRRDVRAYATISSAAING